MQSLLEFRMTRGEINTPGCDTLSTRDAFDLPIRSAIGRMTGVATRRTSRDVRSLVAIGVKADMAVTSADFRV
jgi:hypothetical protein